VKWRIYSSINPKDAEGRIISYLKLVLLSLILSNRLSPIQKINDKYIITDHLIIKRATEELLS